MKDELDNFSCQRCGFCCTLSGYVTLAEGEADKIAAFLNLNIYDFTERYTTLADGRRQLTLIEKDDGRCIFLSSDKTCLIQAVKPLQCVGFPHKWRSQDLEKGCEGLAAMQDTAHQNDPKQKDRIMKKVYLIIIGLSVLTASVATAKSGESADYPLDWRHVQYEPGASMLAENVLSGAKLSVSGQWQRYGPEKVVDGNLDASSHWACEKLPAVLTIEMKKAAKLGFCHIWLYYGEPRVYKFFIETSAKGKEWQRVVDWTDNQKPSGREGFKIPFKSEVDARFMRVTITDSSVRSAGGHIVELKVGQRYMELTSGLQGRVVAADKIKPGDVIADPPTQTWQASAWRNERVNGQFVLWSESAVPQLRLSCSGLSNATGGKINAESVKLRFVRNVLGSGKLYGDVLDTVESVDLPVDGYRPVWLTIAVPKTAHIYVIYSDGRQNR